MRDDLSNLAKRDIRLYVDGNPRGTFSYDTGTDRLKFTSGKLAYGLHKVRVVATDEAGNTGARNWGFSVVRSG